MTTNDIVSVDTIVVGGGIFGRTISQHLSDLGHHVVCFDAAKPNAGTYPSACLIKPSWVARLGKKVVDPALDTLRQTWGMEKLDFTVGFNTKRGLFTEQVHWVDRSRVFANQDYMRWAEVLSVHDDGSVVVREGSEILRIHARNVIVAAGVWSKELVEVPGLKAHFGAACLWQGQLERNFINPWRPYHQLVAFNIDPHFTWVGDGTTVVAHRWKPEQQVAIVDRCRAAIDAKGIPEVRVGMRPYIKGVKHALLEQRSQHVWLATGGAKNGTLGAGWCAHELGRRL